MKKKLLLIATFIVILAILFVVFLKQNKATDTSAQSTPPVEETTETPTPMETPVATDAPTPEPTATPTPEPTATPTPEPTATLTPEPTATPTSEPTATPILEPTATPVPTEIPLPTATPEPTATPTPVPDLASFPHPLNTWFLTFTEQNLPVWRVYCTYSYYRGIVDLSWEGGTNINIFDGEFGMHELDNNMPPGLPWMGYHYVFSSAYLGEYKEGSIYVYDWGAHYSTVESGCPNFGTDLCKPGRID